MLVASGSLLYPSEPYAPELFDLRKRVSFLDRITMLDSVEHILPGAWVGTASQVIRLKGTDVNTWEYDVVADYGVIPGTLAYLDGELYGSDDEFKGDHAAMFSTTRGICIGRPDGTFVNMTEKRYAYPSMDTGAGIVRRHRGTAQYLVTLQGNAVPGNVAS